MRSLGVTQLLVLILVLGVVIDLRRFNARPRVTGRRRRGFTSGRGIPAGADPDQVGLPLRQIQMRTHSRRRDGSEAGPPR